MTEPTCRTCYAHSLPDDQRRRFLTEPVTGCVHYCERHREVVEHLHTLAASFAEFPRVTP